MQSAVDLEMPKLLACYERRAAKLGPSGRHNLPASGRKPRDESLLQISGFMERVSKEEPLEGRPKASLQLSMV